MGFNPLPANLNAYGDVKSNKSNLKNNDMLIQIPSHSNFIIKVIDLKPGRYAIAVQRTKTEASYLAKGEM